MKQEDDRYVFLDRDGVLVKDKGHIYKIEDLEILPGVFEGLRYLKDLGYKFIVVTNQAGIAKGYYKHDDAHAFNEALETKLDRASIKIEAFYICPHHPDHTGDCLCRKPKTGMLEEAARRFSINPEKSFLIGDKDSDIEAGGRWGCKTVRIINGQYPNVTKADYEAGDLLKAAQIIAELN